MRKDLVFDFEFTDTDGVKAKRKVVVKPQDDLAPELTDVRVEVMRKATIKAQGPRRNVLHGDAQGPHSRWARRSTTTTRWARCAIATR